MAAEKSPAFQFYPQDFIADSRVVSMNLRERGAYITLLCHCWIDRELPAELPALARLCHVTPDCFERLWPALKPCFSAKDGGLVQPRIERERQKQAAFRAMKAAAGQKGGRATAEGKQTAGTNEADGAAESSPPSPSPSPSPSSVSDLQSSSSEKNSSGVNSRSKRPIFSGQRFVVFDWMLEDMARTLGAHTDDFDLHSWFFDLDAAMVESGHVLAKDAAWPWLQAQLVEEAKRRGLPMAKRPDEFKRKPFR